MTKSKGIGRGGRRKGAGRPRFAQTGKASNFSTRLTPKTRALLDAEAHRRGESVSKVAEDLLQLGLEEMAAIRNPRPLKALLFLVEALRWDFPDPRAYHLDEDSYSWHSNPYMFVAFRAAVLSLFDVFRPRGKIVAPPPGPPLDDRELGEVQFTFPNSPDEYGRLCARDLLSSARFHSASERQGFKGEPPPKWAFEMPGFARHHYGLADAWEVLNRALRQRGRK